MASPSSAPQAPPDESRYPAVESFVEQASDEDVVSLFQPLRQALDSLPGPMADKAKRVKLALDRAEELLRVLLQTREKLAAERKTKR